VILSGSIVLLFNMSLGGGSFMDWLGVSCFSVCGFLNMHLLIVGCLVRVRLFVVLGMRVGMHLLRLFRLSVGCWFVMLSNLFGSLMCIHLHFLLLFRFHFGVFFHMSMLNVMMFLLVLFSVLVMVLMSGLDGLGLGVLVLLGLCLVVSLSLVEGLDLLTRRHHGLLDFCLLLLLGFFLLLDSRFGGCFVRRVIFLSGFSVHFWLLSLLVVLDLVMLCMDGFHMLSVMMLLVLLSVFMMMLLGMLVNFSVMFGLSG
jgi:hypothetical protein